MDLEFLPRAEKILSARDVADPVLADLLVLFQEVAATNPPTSFPSMARLKGKLRDLFYFRYYRLNQSMRLYFMAGEGALIVVHIIENKRRNDLTGGEEEALKHGLEEGSSSIAQRKAHRLEREQQQAREAAKEAEKLKTKNKRSDRR